MLRGSQVLAKLPETTHVKYDSGLLTISGPVAKRLRISAQAMLQNLMDCVGARSIDLICIAAGAYAIDRISRRSRTKQNQAGVRCFPVCFHVSDLNFWVQARMVDQVSEILNFLTGDLWLVSFKAHARPAAGNCQGLLDLNDAQRPSHVALYSGGLDSAAGFANQLIEGKRDFLLLTAGHQSSIRGRARDQVASLKRLLPTAGAISHASFVVHLEGSGRIRDQETTQRARGFLFCTSAAILAAACSVRDIEIYENGHGAINLPLCTGALTDGFSTRGAHPEFIRLISILVSDALEIPLSFKLPFFGSTKAEMVSGLKGVPGLTSWAMASRSCVHTSWRQGGITHCGKCMACIERHQAFAGAGVDDLTPYSDNKVWELEDAMANDFLRAHLDTAVGWRDGCERTQRRFDAHRILSGIEYLNAAELLELHRRHASETLKVFGHLMERAPTSRAKLSEKAVA
jgi:7-cyano-7-deazaguanine synthase in queuosine biosynthesis